MHDDVAADRAEDGSRAVDRAGDRPPGGGKPAAVASESARSTSWTSSGDAVAEVEQRAGIVDRDRADPGHVRRGAAAARSAAGSGGRSRRSARGRCPARTGAAAWIEQVGGVDRIRLGVDPRRAPVSTSSTPGSSSAAWRPRGPHSSVTRSAPAASARIAGPASRTSPSLSSRTARTSGHAGTSSRSTASVEVARPPGRGVDLLGAGARGRHEHRPRAGGTGGPTSAPMSPTTRTRAGRRRAARRRAGSGRARACGTRSRRPGRAGSTRADRAGRAAPPSARGRRRRPRARAARGRCRTGWRRPRRRRRRRAVARSASTRARHRLDQRRVAVVGDVGDQRAVAVEQHRRRASGTAGARQAPASRRAATMPWQRTGSRRSCASIVATSRGVARPGRDARPRELRGPREPASADEAAARRGAAAAGGERRGDDAPMPAAAVAR